MNDPAPAVTEQSPPQKRRPQRGKQGGTTDADMVSFRLGKEQRAALDARAAESGLSRGAFLRALAVSDIPGPRAKPRLQVDRDALLKIRAHIGHIGANVNQLAYNANVGQMPIEGELTTMLNVLRGLSDEIRAALSRDTAA